jgi:prepilin-type N-terminal cleavage/methylation domain-containing protein
MINQAHHNSLPRRARGMTLSEVMVAVFILSLAILGILGVQMQSRRLTEGSIYQNTAITIVQGYLEQMKNMSINSLINPDPTTGNPRLSVSFSIPALFSDTTTDTIQTSTGPIPALSAITPGVTPNSSFPGIMDNLRGFDMAKDPSATNENSTDTTNGAVSALANWTDVWPGAINYTTATSNGAISTTTGKNDLHLNLWVWIQDLSGTTTVNAKQTYGITIIYTWQFLDGGRVRYAVASVRSVRSIVPSF